MDQIAGRVACNARLTAQLKTLSECPNPVPIHSDATEALDTDTGKLAALLKWAQVPAASVGHFSCFVNPGPQLPLPPFPPCPGHQMLSASQARWAH